MVLLDQLFLRHILLFLFCPSTRLLEAVFDIFFGAARN